MAIDTEIMRMFKKQQEQINALKNYTQVLTGEPFDPSLFQSGTFPRNSRTTRMRRLPNDITGKIDVKKTTYTFDTRKFTQFREQGTYWDDLRVAASATRINPERTKPDFDTFLDGTLTYLFDPDDDETVHFSVQLPHSWKEGSLIYPHIHWTPTNTNTGSVVWELEYTMQTINGVAFPSTTKITTTDQAGGTAYAHQVASFDPIDTTGMKISTMLVCAMSRLGTDGSDTYNADAAFLEFDIHFEIDSVGSDEEFVKDGNR